MLIGWDVGPWVFAPSFNDKVYRLLVVLEFYLVYLFFEDKIGSNAVYFLNLVSYS